MSQPLQLLRGWAEQQAFAALRDACLAGCGSAPEQVLLALAQAHLGDAEAARQTLAALDGTAPELDLATRIDLAAVHLALHDLDTAAGLLEAAAPEAGEHGLLLARLGWCRMQQGRPDDARALYARSAAAEPRLPVLLNLLRLQLLADMPAAAQHSLDQACARWAGEHADASPERRQQVQQQLRGLQLDIWLAGGQHAAAEAWLAEQRMQLAQDDWCTLVLGCSHRLAAQDRHAQADDLLRDAQQHAPEHIGLCLQRAELALVQGRAQQGAALLRRAIHLSEAQGHDTLPLWVRLSAACLQHDDAAARLAAEQALEQAEPPHPQALLALAAVEVQEQQLAQAEARYQALLAQQPDLAPALHGLGQLLMQQGRIDEAVARFEQLRLLDPAKGLAALINARRFPQDAAALEHLEQAARMPGLEGSVRTGLLFQLAAAWEQRQDHDRAFALADEANAASRHHLRYDPVAHRQHCARIRHAFTRELYQHRSGGLPSSVPVFVVGMPRSGTTLVEQILAGHSQIHGAGELGLIPRVIATLQRWERRTGSGRRYPDCVDDLAPGVLSGIAGQVLQELQAFAPDARHVVDKLPHNFENIGLIKLLFPHAKIISVRRDPRDIALSNYCTDYGAKHGGMGFAYDLDWIGEQLADHNLLMHTWQQLFPGEILEVQYEDVVAGTEAAARRLLRYIGVDWEPGVLAFNTLQRPVKTASVWQVRQPIYTSSTAKWTRYAKHLAPLIRATNRKIGWQPITDMLTLPEPGLLERGVAHYRARQLDDAERCFKQLLHHVPGHAAATFLVGLIDVHKGWLPEGIAQMEQAVQRCPWNRGWRDDLARARALAGLPAGDAEAVPADTPLEDAAW
ncbi:sulfotransferase [Rubrivivax sp. RP6-9]|uniref:sulfotransferase n=1 Tax=Rubrivivax sp. RP6-9 TaxID=3415750 RepID=UPI003CC690DA